MNDSEIRLRCLEMAQEGRAGWGERDVLRIASEYYEFTRSGLAIVSKGDAPDPIPGTLGMFGQASHLGKIYSAG